MRGLGTDFGSCIVADFSGFGVDAALGWCVVAGIVSLRGLGSDFGSRVADLVSVLGFDSVFGSCVAAGFVSVRGLDSDFGSRMVDLVSVLGSDSVFGSRVVAALVSVCDLASDLVSVRGLASAGLVVVRSRDAVLAGAAVEDLNAAGLAVAVTAERPWLTEAN